MRPLPISGRRLVSLDASVRVTLEAILLVDRKPHCRSQFPIKGPGFVYISTCGGCGVAPSVSHDQGDRQRGGAELLVRRPPRGLDAN